MFKRSRNQTGKEVAEEKAIGFKLMDNESQTIADAADATYLFTETLGIFFVTVGTSSAVFGLYNAAGTPTTVLLAGAAGTFTITKDNASTINVYWETSAVVVQNNSGASIDAEVKGLL